MVRPWPDQPDRVLRPCIVAVDRCVMGVISHGLIIFNICRKLVGEDSQVLLSEKQDCAFAYVSKKYIHMYSQNLTCTAPPLSLSLSPTPPLPSPFLPLLAGSLLLPQ